MQVSSKSICVPSFLWNQYDKTGDVTYDQDFFIIEVGDENKNFMRVRRDAIDLISIMEYVKEEDAAKRSGLMVPDRSLGPRLR